MSAFCRWYEKDMENLSEHEQELCKASGCDCCECTDLIVKDSSRMMLQEFGEAEQALKQMGE